MAEGLLTCKEVADLLQVSVGAVRAWIQKEKLGCVRIGHRTVRISPSDLDAFIQKHTKYDSENRR